jgi:tetratricopeptide (TPR) repeat protein
MYNAGAITLINAAKTRGNVYYNSGNYRLAEKEYRLALAEKPASTTDSMDYYLSATALSYTLIMKGNEEEALRTGIPAIEALKKWYQEKPTPFLCDKLMNLTQHIGWIQKDLGMNEGCFPSHAICQDQLWKV